MLPRRFACLLAIGAAFGSLVVPGVAAAAERQALPRTSSVAPVAIELPGLFGDENESDEDENEPEEDARAGDRSPQRSGPSVAGLLLPVSLGLVVVGMTARLLRRRYG